MTYKAIIENMIKAKAIEKVEAQLDDTTYRFSTGEIKTIENNNEIFPAKDFMVQVTTTTKEWAEREFEAHGWINEYGFISISIIWEITYDKGYRSSEIFYQ